MRRTLGIVIAGCVGCYGGSNADADQNSSGATGATPGATGGSGADTDAESTPGSATSDPTSTDSGPSATGSTGESPAEPFDPNSVPMPVYWTSPTGVETDLSAVSFDNPADLRWITDGDGATQLPAPSMVYFRHDQGPYQLEGGFRLLAQGDSDTYEGAIHYRSAPGGIAVFEIARYPQDNHRHLDRYRNPGGIQIGGEWYWKNPNDQSDPVDGWNTFAPEESSLGRHVWLSEIVLVGQYSADDDPKRDLGSLDIPYGSTGLREPGTITGGQVYDKMTGGIGIQAVGSRVNNCMIHNSPKGSVGVSSAILSSDIHIYGNLITNTGHSGPDGRDHFHNAYIQWRSDAAGRLKYKHNILQFSAEEQAQFWSQSGVENQGEPDEYSKVDRLDIEDNVFLLGGTLNGQNYPGRSNRNALIGGYTWDESITFVGNMSFHDSSSSAQFGYSDNSNNERRNMVVRDNILVGESPLLQNVQSIADISNNTIVVPGSRLLQIRIGSGREGDYDESKLNQAGNHYYYGGDSPYVSKTVTVDPQVATTPSFEEWQGQGTDAGSTATQGVPDDIVRVLPNENRASYDSDWLGHFVVYNFSRASTQQVDLSELGLHDGDTYRVIDTQTVAPDLIGNYVFEATFDANNPRVEIPMVYPAQAVPDPTGEMIDPYHSDERFFCGLVYRTTPHESLAAASRP